MNKILEISLKVLSPVHISSGKEIQNNEYIIKNNKFCRFNFNKLIIKLDDNEKEKLLKEIEEKSPNKIRTNINSFLNEKFNKIDFEYKINIEKIKGKIEGEKIDNLIQDLYEKNLKQISIEKSNSLNIKEFINVYYKKYIPGSSIKGAIRTALIDQSFSNDYDKLEKDKKINEDYFKNLIVTDSKFNTDNENIEISAISRASKNNFIEVLQPNFETRFYIKIRNDDKFNENNIIRSINNFYKKNLLFYIDKLKDVNEKLNNDDRKDKERKKERNSKVIFQFKKILKIINELEENEFILNIGFGGGKIFKTVDSKISGIEKRFRPSFKNKLNLGTLEIPYTISLVNEKIMGWVKCKIL